VYRHWDGYLSGVLPDLAEFFKWNGSRNSDLSYAVANFVTWSKIGGTINRCQMNKKHYAKEKNAKTYPKTFEQAFKNPDPNMGNLHTGFGIQPHLATYDDFKDDVFIEFFYKVELFESGNVSVKAYSSGSDGLTLLAELTFWVKQQKLLESASGKSAEAFCIDYDKKQDEEYEKQKKLEEKEKITA